MELNCYYIIYRIILFHRTVCKAAINSNDIVFYELDKSIEFKESFTSIPNREIAC